MLFCGCTHYPLIENQIKKVLGKDILFFNGAKSLAKHLKDILEQDNLLNESNGTIEFIDSQKSLEKEKRFYKYLEVK